MEQNSFCAPRSGFGRVGEETRAMARPSNNLNEVVRLRVTAEEKAALATLCEREGVSESDAIRRLLRQETGLLLPVARVDRPLLNGLEDQLRRVGGNLNQAVRAMNEGRVGYEPDLHRSLLGLTELIAGIRRQMQAMAKPARHEKEVGQ